MNDSQPSSRFVRSHVTRKRTCNHTLGVELCLAHRSPDLLRSLHTGNLLLDRLRIAWWEVLEPSPLVLGRRELGSEKKAGSWGKKLGGRRVTTRNRGCPDASASLIVVQVAGDHAAPGDIEARRCMPNPNGFARRRKIRVDGPNHGVARARRPK